ncbi:hypothetical protein [Aureispira anguillae]|uniref:Uncharacterized protein n=1 Tax=Aureispira anguillae TaxID=2864201 RepID=A0A915YFI5_9BACT|nr:hypothetical protein [Aureispira anguillae]BDS12197.1 hypothetical protein AsAng_0029120 [Aureispira anguillae]
MNVVKKSTSKSVKQGKSKEQEKEQTRLTKEELKEKEDRMGTKRRGLFVKSK